MEDEKYNDQSDLAKKIYQWKKDAESHSHKWRKNAREDFDFYAGNQWDDDDKAMLEEQGRPIVTFNRVTTVINAISGFEGANRTEVKYLPRTLDDAGTDMYTQAAKWARDESDADDEQSDAFKDCVVCGMGWTRTKMDYEDNPDGIPVEERISPLSMYWDHNSKKQNLMDARYVIEERAISRESMRELYPEQYQDIVDLDMSEVYGEEHSSQDAWKYENDQSDNERANTYKVCYCEWFEREPYYRFVDPQTNKVLEAPVNKFKAMKDNLDALGVQYVRQVKKVYYSIVIAGQIVLEEKKRLSTPKFTYQCITGYRDQKTNSFFGLMRLMIDPQRWSNKFFSQFMDIVSANSKGGLLYETDAIKDIRKLEDDWANPTSAIELNEGGLEKVRERQMQQFPSSIDRLLQLAVQATRDVTGVNLEFLGMANREQAGVVESERKRATLVILSDLFNSLRRFKRNQGRVLLHYIHNFMRDGQLIRIVGKDGEQYLPFMKDRSAMTYDVIVDTAPDSPNMKQEAWSSIREILPTMMSAGVPIPQSIIKVLPIPTSMAMQWEKEIQEQNQPDENQQKAQQIQMEQALADIEETKSKAALNMAKAQNEGNSDPHEYQLEMARLEIERARILTESQKIQTESQIKLREIEQKEKDIKVKEKQVESRIKEAQIKAKAEIATASINAKQQKQAEPSERKEREPQIPNIEVNIDRSGKKEIRVKKNKDGSIEGTVEETNG